MGEPLATARLKEEERHELECLRARVSQIEYPCSPHCAGYLRELAQREILSELLRVAELALEYCDYEHIRKQIRTAIAQATSSPQAEPKA